MMLVGCGQADDGFLSVGCDRMLSGRLVEDDEMLKG